MMKAKLYKLECLTNLHAGSGDVNYNIIDKEVEKDPTTEYPTIHASGVKGALRDAAKAAGMDIDYIFGKPGSGNMVSPGKYRFFEAKFLSRPLRVGGNANRAYVPVTTVQAINDFINLTNSFDCGKISSEISVDFNKNGKNIKFFVSDASITDIEGEKSIEKLDAGLKEILKPILGETFAIADSFDDYPLPSVARNHLDDGGISENLWYEEFVPHQSVFYMIVLRPDDDKINCDFMEELKVVQFGGNASVGNGFVKITEFKEA